MKKPASSIALAATLLCATAATVAGPTAPTAAPSATAAAVPAVPAAVSPATYTQTRYPVVLVHGLFGFDTLQGVEYFYGIPEALRAGGATVIVVQVSAANSTEVRGEQLLKQLQQLQATYGYEKFNLIGHSHGSTTVRYVAGVAPELTASITTIGGPNAGTKVADAILAGTDSTGTTPVLAPLVDAFAKLIGVASDDGGLPQDGVAAGRSNTTAGVAAFNARFPDGQPTTPCGTGPELVNGVRYYSYGGGLLLTNPLDISDPFLTITAVPFGLEPNDGLVSTCSSRWGTVIRADMPWNHLDEINQAFGLRAVFAPDPPTVYRTQVNRLKNAGL